ncbi:MAG: flagellar hook protein FlgE [Acidobacteriota bacterium]|nr:flagellar hook protein FlgE [Acidobacteriota bacterium]
MLTGSFYTGLSGLQSNATALNVVGNNLANINTTGFKRSQANFAQIMSNTIRGISGAGNPLQVGLGVQTSEVVAKFEQGSIQTTGIKTHLAIQGEGFFQVNVNGTNAYTRAGTFGFDEEGFLVAATGGNVQGFVGTDANGNLDIGAGIQNIQIDLGQAAPPRATDLVRFITNLSAEAVLNDSYPTTIEVFDSKGVSHQLNMTFTKTANTGEWSYQFAFNGDAAVITGGGNGTGGGTVTFDNTGELLSIDGTNINTAGIPTVPSPEPTITIASADIPSGAADLNITWNALEAPNDPTSQPASSFVTNFGNINSTGTLFQNGFGSGILQDIDFDQDGTMIGFFDNGLSLELARVAVATFNNRQGLKQIDGSFYLPTAASGPASIDGEGTGGRGSIIASSLESSNVDIAEEFTSLIIHQRGYQSNSRTITTVDQLLQEALNLKR